MTSKNAAKPKKKPITEPQTWLQKNVTKANQARRQFLNRRPHRSFRRTKRRDYKRSLKLPGFFAFSFYVHKTMWKYKLPLFCIGIVYGILIAVFTSVMSESTYQGIATAVQGATDGLSSLGNAALTLAITVSSSATSSTQAGQSSQVGGVFIGSLAALLIWLTVVWYLRNRLANRNVKVRDAFYNAGAPILSTFIIFMIMVLQLIPAALGVMAVVAGISTGLVNNGAAAMLLTLGVGLLVVLSLFWITSSLMGLIVVTLPGMYPLRALSIAGDMVVGRRVKLLLRLVWLGLSALIAWAVLLIPVIMFDSWLKQNLHVATGIPIVPYAMVAMSAFTLIWSASYVYLLYRKVVDDDALPA